MHVNLQSLKNTFSGSMSVRKLLLLCHKHDTKLLAGMVPCTSCQAKLRALSSGASGVMT